ncbi:MAG TPA: alpha/beta fold hydrolase [Candidatus Acidoferrales bacterium]|nr:alpha/beta fold hydrolase [Candidatus Acidoferrales bacterium]
MDSSRYLPEPFVPRRGLRNGHLQTFAGNFMKRPNLLPEPEERLFSVEPEVQVLCHCHWQPERSQRLTVLIVHGLEGSSQSQYVLGLGYKAWQRGCNVVRMNVRNCGGTEHLGPTLYTSGLSGDLQAVIHTLIEQDNLKRIALVGYSMGGNQVLKAMGEWSAQAPKELIGAAAVSPSADLSACADAVHRRSNRAYEWWFVWPLRARMRRKAELFPGRYDLTHLGRARSVREFDDLFTAPYMGYKNAEDYYSQCSSSRVLDRIARPTLVIHALDDPFVVLLPETERKLRDNPSITYLRCAHGGHCAFLAAPNGYDGRWAEQQVVNFLSCLESPAAK